MTRRVLAALVLTFLGACSYELRHPAAPRDAAGPDDGPSGQYVASPEATLPSIPMSPPPASSGVSPLVGSPTGWVEDDTAFLFDVGFVPLSVNLAGNGVAGPSPTGAGYWLNLGSTAKTSNLLVGDVQIAAMVAGAPPFGIGTVHVSSGPLYARATSDPSQHRRGTTSFDCVEIPGARAAQFFPSGSDSVVVQPIVTLDPNDTWSFASAALSEGGIVGTSGTGMGPCPGSPPSSPARERGFFSDGKSMIPVGPMSGDDASRALAVSRDNSTVLGVSFDLASGAGRLFLWKAGMPPLTITPTRASVVMRDESAALVAGIFNAFLSADGSAVAGTLIEGLEGTSSFRWRAFRWSAVSGLVMLDLLPAMTASSALAIGDDGLTVVGYDAADGSTLTGGPDVWFRWTASGGTQRLASSSTNANPYLVSADASKIVATSATDGQVVVFDGVSPTAIPFANAQVFLGRCPSPQVTTISNSGKVLGGICRGAPPGWIAFRQ